MSDSHPAISVLMSVHNGEAYLGQAIDSILCQTFTNFEFIIVDDASDDGTAIILKEYAGRDQRLILLGNEKNLGLTKSLNRGLTIARGELIARQDADDVSHSDRLQRQWDFLRSHPDVVLVGSRFVAIDKNGERVGEFRLECDHEAISRRLIQDNHFGHGTAMYRNTDNLMYDEKFRVAQDYDLFTRFAISGRVANMPEFLYDWRTHSASITSRHSLEQDQNRRIISNHYIMELIRTKKLETLLGACFDDLLLAERLSAVRSAVAATVPDSSTSTDLKAAIHRGRGHSIHLLRMIPTLIRFTGFGFTCRWYAAYLPRLLAHGIRVLSGRR